MTEKTRNTKQIGIACALIALLIVSIAIAYSFNSQPVMLIGGNSTQGTPGINGAKGDTGPQGLQGIPGTDGLPGINGVNFNATGNIFLYNGTNGNIYSWAMSNLTDSSFGVLSNGDIAIYNSTSGKWNNQQPFNTAWNSSVNQLISNHAITWSQITSGNSTVNSLILSYLTSNPIAYSSLLGTPIFPATATVVINTFTNATNTYYQAVNAAGTITVAPATSYSSVETSVLGSLTSGTVVCNQVPFSLALMNSIPANVQVTESVGNLTRTFINPAASTGSPYTISVNGANSFVSDSENRIYMTSTNESSIIQNAVNTVEAQNGGSIYVSGNSHTWTHSIIFDGALMSGGTVEFYGDGYSTTQITQSGSTYGIVLQNGVTVNFHDFTLGVTSSGYDAIYGSPNGGSDTESTRYSTFSNFYLSGGSGYSGMHLSNYICCTGSHLHLNAGNNGVAFLLDEPAGGSVSGNSLWEHIATNTVGTSASIGMEVTGPSSGRHNFELFNYVQTASCNIGVFLNNTNQVQINMLDVEKLLGTNPIALLVSGTAGQASSGNMITGGALYLPSASSGAGIGIADGNYSTSTGTTDTNTFKSLQIVGGGTSSIAVSTYQSYQNRDTFQNIQATGTFAATNFLCNLAYPPILINPSRITPAIFTALQNSGAATNSTVNQFVIPHGLWSTPQTVNYLTLSAGATVTRTFMDYQNLYVYFTGSDSASVLCSWSVSSSSPRTDYLTSNFESGSLVGDGWTTQNQGASTSTILTTLPNTGLYGATLTSPAGVMATIHQNLGSSVTTLSYRFYVNLTTLPTTNWVSSALNYVTNGTLGNENTGAGVAIAGIAISSTSTPGTYQWGGSYMNAGVSTNRDCSGSTFTLQNKLYWVQMDVTTAASTGSVTITVDGVQVYQVTGLANTGWGSISTIYAGVGYTASNKAVTLIEDDIQVAGTSVGPMH